MLSDLQVSNGDFLVHSELTGTKKNYAEYNQSLRDRGRIDIWLSDDIIENWQTEQRSYDGTGSSPKYPDSTLKACH